MSLATSSASAATPLLASHSHYLDYEGYEGSDSDSEFLTVKPREVKSKETAPSSDAKTSRKKQEEPSPAVAIAQKVLAQSQPSSSRECLPSTLKFKCLDITPPPPRIGLLNKVIGSLFSLYTGEPKQIVNPLIALMQESEQKSNLAQQLKFLSKTLEHTPEADQWGIYYLRCQYRIKNGDYNGALEDIERSISQNPTPEADYFKANILAFRDQNPQLAEAFCIIYNVLNQGLTSSTLLTKLKNDQEEIVRRIEEKAAQAAISLTPEELCILTLRLDGYESRLIECLYQEELEELPASCLAQLIKKIEKAEKINSLKNLKIHFALGFLKLKLVLIIDARTYQGTISEELINKRNEYLDHVLVHFRKGDQQNCAKSTRELGRLSNDETFDSLTLLKKAAAQFDVEAMLLLAYKQNTTPNEAAGYLKTALRLGNLDQKQYARSLQLVWEKNWNKSASTSTLIESQKLTPQQLFRIQAYDQLRKLYDSETAQAAAKQEAHLKKEAQAKQAEQALVSTIKELGSIKYGSDSDEY